MFRRPFGVSSLSDASDFFRSAPDVAHRRAGLAMCEGLLNERSVDASLLGLRSPASGDRRGATADRLVQIVDVFGRSPMMSFC